MTPHYLAGPVGKSEPFGALALSGRGGECLTFGPEGADLVRAPGEPWDSLSARLPGGFAPDFIALWLEGGPVPGWVFSAPVPVVALLPRPRDGWQGHRLLLGRCDLAITGPEGAAQVARQGIPPVQTAFLLGGEEQLLEPVWAGAERDIDVLLLTRKHPALSPGSLAWLGQVLAPGSHRRIQIAACASRQERLALARRGRVVLGSASLTDEALAWESLAAGALLLWVGDDALLRATLRPGGHHVACTAETLGQVLEQYLGDEEERDRIARAGQARARELAFARQWRQALAGIERQLPHLRQRCRERLTREGPSLDLLLGRSWLALDGTRGDPSLEKNIEAALAREPGSAELHTALALLKLRGLQGAGPLRGEAVSRVLPHLEQALRCAPEHPLVLLNLAEALATLRQDQPAVELASRALALLEKSPAEDPLLLRLPHFPHVPDLFTQQWQQAAWQHPGEPQAEQGAKQDLLRWRLHTLLGDLTGEIAHHYEAVLIRPDLPNTQAALGCALGRAGKPALAVPHLRQAVLDSPLDSAAARALYQALMDSGQEEARRLSARQRRLLKQVAPTLTPEESWAQQAPPVGDELASIIIPCCNEAALTRACLESLLQYTRSPFELILVDNGSSDETLSLLEEHRQRLGPERVQVIRNEQNLGYAKACNQGVVQSQGKYLVFLNNDTVLTDGWLEGLIRWATHDWPRVGLVGPVTGYAPPPQLVEPGYQDLAGLQAFARQRSVTHRGQVLEFPRLTGFCLLARREVLDQVGGFDEGYGLGFFEDDDLCLRVRQAGYRLLVAQDVYIHHHGSRTFRSLGIDTERQLAENLERFRQKWGEGHASHYRLPGRSQTRKAAPGSATGAAFLPRVGDVTAGVASAGTAPSRRSQRVSLCMVVRNEEGNIADCLGGARGLFDEIVVLDTGSTDRTREIALQLGAKVHDFPWVDSFAAARNESLKYATGDWVFWLDGDDRLDEANRQKLARLFSTLKPEMVGYSMKCLCLPDPESGAATEVDHVRLFPWHPEVRWEHRVHEQILPALRRLGGQVRFVDITIQHTGYQDKALRARKLQRDLRLLRLELEEKPEHPFTLFNLGSVLQETGEHGKALPVLRRSLELSHPKDSIVRKLYSLLVGCHRSLNQEEEALRACQRGLEHYPEDDELLFIESILLKDRGDLQGAKRSLEKLRAGTTGAHFASVDTGVRGYKARHNLAVILRELGELPQAEREWQEALKEREDFGPGWLGLGELYLGRKRWGELEQVVRMLEEKLNEGVAASLLRGRAHLARQEFPAARGILEEVTRKEPGKLAGWVVLSHVLLQEGKDLEAAERVLRKILEMEPGHREARQNLGVLLRERRSKEGTS